MNENTPDEASIGRGPQGCTPKSIDIHIDFHADLNSICRDQLAAAGNEVSPSEDGDEILYRWFHTCDRIPVARPRKTHKSREFTDPGDPELKKGLALVERKLALGETIFHHLSRKIHRLMFHDLLLNDWGIQHLHLKASLADNGLIKGTKEVVYCVFEPNDVYLIQVLNHQWYDPVLLEIMNANWPHLLTRLPLYPPVDPTGEIKASTPDGVKVSRAATVFQGGGPGVTSLVTLRDGTVVMPPGGGFTSSGHSLRVMRRVVELRHIVGQWEDMARESVRSLVKEAKEHGIEAPSRLRFELRHNAGGHEWCAYAHELQIHLVLPTDYATQPAA